MLAGAGSIVGTAPFLMMLCFELSKHCSGGDGVNKTTVACTSACSKSDGIGGMFQDSDGEPAKSEQFLQHFVCQCVLCVYGCAKRAFFKQCFYSLLSGGKAHGKWLHQGPMEILVRSTLTTATQKKPSRHSKPSHQAHPPTMQSIGK